MPMFKTLTTAEHRTGIQNALANHVDYRYVEDTKQDQEWLIVSYPASWPDHAGYFAKVYAAATEGRVTPVWSGPTWATVASSQKSGEEYVKSLVQTAEETVSYLYDAIHTGEVPVSEADPSAGAYRVEVFREPAVIGLPPSFKYLLSYKHPVTTPEWTWVDKHGGYTSQTLASNAAYGRADSLIYAALVDAKGVTLEENTRYHKYPDPDATAAANSTPNYLIDQARELEAASAALRSLVTHLEKVAALEFRAEDYDTSFISALRDIRAGFIDDAEAIKNLAAQRREIVGDDLPF